MLKNGIKTTSASTDYPRVKMVNDKSNKHLTIRIKKVMERKNSIGMRVRLTKSGGTMKVKKGDEGVVYDFDTGGTLFVKWDNGEERTLRRGADDWIPVYT
jgi:hypothetical protein